MSEREIVAVILAAGKGTRMKTSLAKVLHKIAGRPLINHLLATLDKAGISKTVVVVSPEAEDVSAAVAPHKTAVQTEQLGTADAAASAYPELKDFAGDMMILCGDAPLLSEATIKRMRTTRAEGFDLVLLGFKPKDCAAYGRIVLLADGNVERIVEFADASAEEKVIDICNSGLMCGDAQKIFFWLRQVKPANAKGEYYLTDVVEIARKEGAKVGLVLGAEEELLGVNTLYDLAAAEKVVQQQLRRKFMSEGVTLIDPDTVYFSYDTQIGRNVIIEPSVFFGTGVTVDDDTIIKAFSHFEEAKIGKAVNIGPFSRLRPQADIGEGAHIGNFVEVKKSMVEKGAKVNHLSYIGDTRVGSKANIGAGTITCNYDGFTKSHTDIGEGAFIGSNTCLIAPVTIGDGAIIGAGSAIAVNVEKDALALTRAPQVEKKGWAARFRAIKGKK